MASQSASNYIGGKRKKWRTTASSSSFEDALEAQRTALANQENQASTKPSNLEKTPPKLAGYHFDVKANRYFKITKDNANLIHDQETKVSKSHHQSLSHQQSKTPYATNKSSLSLLTALHNRSYANTTRQTELIASSLINSVIPLTFKIKYLDVPQPVVNDTCELCYHSIFGLTLATSHGITLIPPSSRSRTTTHNQMQPNQYIDLRPFLASPQKHMIPTIKRIDWINSTSSSSSTNYSTEGTEPNINDILVVVSTSLGRDNIHLFSFIPSNRSTTGNSSSERGYSTLWPRYTVKLVAKLAIGNSEVHSIAAATSFNLNEWSGENTLSVCMDKFIKSFSFGYCSDLRNFLTGTNRSNFGSSSSSNSNTSGNSIGITLPSPHCISLNSPIVSLHVINNNATLIGGQRNGDVVLVDTRISSMNSNKSALSIIAKMTACIDQIMPLDLHKSSSSSSFSSLSPSLFLVLDVLGKMSIYDIRRPNIEYLSIVPSSNSTCSQSHCSNGSSARKMNNSTSSLWSHKSYDQIPVRNRRFWLPSSSQWQNTTFISNSSNSNNSHNSSNNNNNNSSGSYCLTGFVVTPHAHAQPKGLCVYSLTEPNHLLHIIPFSSSSSVSRFESLPFSSSSLLQSPLHHPYDHRTNANQNASVDTFSSHSNSRSSSSSSSSSSNSSIENINSSMNNMNTSMSCYDMSRVKLVSSYYRNSSHKYSNNHYNRCDSDKDNRRVMSIYDKNTIDNCSNSKFENWTEGLYGMIDSQVIFQGINQ